VLLGLLLLAALAADQASAALVGSRATSEGRLVTLDTGGLRLELLTTGNRVRVTRLSSQGGRNEVGGAGAGGLWLVKVGGPGGEGVLTEAEASGLATTTGPDRVVFTWRVPRSGAACQVALTVRVVSGDPLSYWSLRVATPPDLQVTDVEFPRLTNLRLRRDMRLAVPWCDGVEYDLRPGMAYSDVYPSMLVAMQFVALYAAGQGVYVAAHDPQASSKTITARARQDGVEVIINPWPEVSAKPGGGWRTGYETAVGVFRGDWCQAAATYRQFAATTPWWRAAAAPSSPTWFRDLDLWLLNDASSFSLDTEAVARAGEYFKNVRKGIHWYNWYQYSGGDTMSCYPDFVARDGFPEAVKEVQRAGFRVMPYTDGRLWREDNPTYAAEKADELATRQADGAINEEYTRCAVVCPWLPRWQSKVADVARRVVSEYGADAVYVDEIGAARAVRCYAAAHGHPLAGGHWWVDGYREMSDALRKALPPEAAFTTEHAAECYLGSFDGFCTVNNPKVPPAVGRAIPLFAAVYAGRTTPFGFRSDDCTEEGFAHPLAFRQNQADGFLRGGQLGWVHTRILMQPRAAAEAAFLRNLVRVRAQSHAFLAYGSFIGPVEVGGDNPRLTAEVSMPAWMVWVPDWAPFEYRSTARYDIAMPAVQATAWRAVDGALGVAVVNVSARERAVSLRLPLAAAGLRPGAHLRLRVVGPESSRNAVLDGELTRDLRVPADSALLIEARQS
jgi:hypothetical protein